MQRILAALVTALAVVALPHYAAAEDGKRPERPNPESMFNRLDANHDGVITPNEVPAGMPEGMKNLLLQTIKNHGGKLTKAELIAAVNRHREGPRPDGRGGLTKTGSGMLTLNGENTYTGKTIVAEGVLRLEGRGPRPERPAPQPEARRPLEVEGPGTLVVNGNLVLNGGTLVINGGTLIVGGPVPPPKGPAPQGRPMPKPMGNVAPSPLFHAKAIFDCLDTNKDGKLSFDEFCVGLRQLHGFLAARAGEMKGPLQLGMQFAHGQMSQFKDQFAKCFGMGPMGPHPGMGPMGPMGAHPGVGPMGQQLGVGPMGQQLGMGPMGMHPGMGPMGPMGPHPGMGPMGDKHEMKKPEGCMCGAKKGEPCKCGAKKPVVCKCGAKAGEPCKCGKKPEAEKPIHHAHALERATAGNRSIEERLTVLEKQQVEILALLRAEGKPADGGKRSHRGEHRSEHEDRD